MTSHREPTTAGASRDMSGLRNGASSAADDWSRCLVGFVGAYKRTDVRRCACGGSIRADRQNPAFGVRSHQRTQQHQNWRLGWLEL